MVFIHHLRFITNFATLSRSHCCLNDFLGCFKRPYFQSTRLYCPKSLHATSLFVATVSWHLQPGYSYFSTISPRLPPKLPVCHHLSVSPTSTRNSRRSSTLAIHCSALLFDLWTARKVSYNTLSEEKWMFCSSIFIYCPYECHIRLTDNYTGLLVRLLLVFLL